MLEQFRCRVLAVALQKSQRDRLARVVQGAKAVQIAGQERGGVLEGVSTSTRGRSPAGAAAGSTTACGRPEVRVAAGPVSAWAMSPGSIGSRVAMASNRSA